MKWSWTGHIIRIKDELGLCTSPVTTWIPYEKKRQGRPTKWWRDDLDKYKIGLHGGGMLRSSPNMDQDTDP